MAEFEQNYLRKTYRLKLPARVLIEGKEYEVIDWSYEGFGIKKNKEENFDKEKEYSVTFILPFASFSVSFNARAKLRWQKDEKAGFQFINLSDEIKLMIRSYVEAYIQGKLEDIGGILSVAKHQVVPPQIEKPLTEEERRKLNLKLFVSTILYTSFFILLVIGFVVVFQHFQKVKSVEAFYSGNLFYLLSPKKAIVKTIFVEEGENVQPKELLASLELIKENFNEKNEEMRLKLERLRSEAKFVENQITLFKKELNKLNERFNAYLRAYDMGYISKADLEKLEEKRRKYLKLIEELKHKLNLLRNEINKISKIRKSKEDMILPLYSRVHGRVISIFKKEGELVKDGEPILVIEDFSKKGYVIGRFKEDEARYITVGDRAEVYFPSIEKRVSGIVVGIGKAALSEGDIVSETEEFALRDVPVKVKLFEYPKGLHYGLSADIVIHTKTFKPFFVEFILRLLQGS